MKAIQITGAMFCLFGTGMSVWENLQTSRSEMRLPAKKTDEQIALNILGTWGFVLAGALMMITPQ